MSIQISTFKPPIPIEATGSETLLLAVARGLVEVIHGKRAIVTEKLSPGATLVLIISGRNRGKAFVSVDEKGDGMVKVVPDGPSGVVPFDDNGVMVVGTGRRYVLTEASGSDRLVRLVREDLHGRYEVETVLSWVHPR